MNDSRRNFLKKAAILAGATGMANLVPASIQRAMAINAPAGSTYLDAEHIVILMQENRSFDHCFGTLKGVRGYNDPRAIDLPNGNPVWLQSNNEGETYAPFHLDIKNTKATWMDSLPHSWQNQVDAFNDGKFDQWLNVKKNSIKAYSHMPLTLGYHTREDIPFYYALADAFTVCDQNFCSALTGTNPNRLFFWTGTVREEQNENSRAHVWNDDMDYGTLNWTTFPERLEALGISWKCYQNEMSIDVGFEGEEDPWLSNFQDNPLEFFSQYHIHLHPKHLHALEKRSAQLPAKIEELKKKIDALPAGDAHIDHLKHELNDLQNYLTAINNEKQKYTAADFDQLSTHQKNIHLKAFTTNKNDPHYHTLTTLKYDDNGVEREVQVPKGDVLHQFREDVKNGQLPTVSWLTAPENFSDHPSSAWYGAWYLSETIDILTQNPEIWKKTIFILTYDENDGYFDHVPPFVAPHSHKTGTGKVSNGMDTRAEFVTLEQEQERKGFPEKYDRENSIGLGFRVPMVIASPWSKGGWVNSEVFDHTSTLQFLEHFLSKKTGKKVVEPNISDWRRTVCGDLTSVFRPQMDAGPDHPDFVERDPFVEGIHKAQFRKLPDDYKLLNEQEIAAFKKSPADSPWMAKQEKGIKPSCALNYELYADGVLSADKKTFTIAFSAGNSVFGEKASGSPFLVYAPGSYLKRDGSGFEPVRTWSYALSAGDTLSDSWAIDEFGDKNYHLKVYGPNGFYRVFTGNAQDPDLEVTLSYQKAAAGQPKLSGNIELLIRNKSKVAQTISVVDNAYHSNKILKEIAADSSSSIVIDPGKSYGWYDFSIKISDNSLFERRYAGRVENGKNSYSDPYMGRVV